MLSCLYPASNYFKQPAAPKGASPAGSPSKPGQPAPAAVDPWSLPPATASLGWPLGQKLDMHVYLSTSDARDEPLPNFVWENLTFGDWKETRSVEYDIKFPKVGRLKVYLTKVVLM